MSSALCQEMAWFDTGMGDPQELPVMAANALDMIQLALGRSVAYTFANLLSAVGCLMVALGLDMVCILPIIGITIAIIFCFVRKYSGLALAEFASAGASASEVITGIKTIASLQAEKWAVTRDTACAVNAQKFSVKLEVYKKLASGVMGVVVLRNLHCCLHLWNISGEK